MAAFTRLADSGQTIVFPVHPRTRLRLKKLSLQYPKRLLMVDPVPYLDMVLLEAHARLIATDSGGIQKEAYWLRVPCLTLRDETEWTETVTSGWNRLVGVASNRIVAAVKEAQAGLNCEWTWSKGEASQTVARMVAALSSVPTGSNGRSDHDVAVVPRKRARHPRVSRSSKKAVGK
jgi:UDP-GlcNAc3NAcA epimerase